MGAISLINIGEKPERDTSIQNSVVSKKYKNKQTKPCKNLVESLWSSLEDGKNGSQIILRIITMSFIYFFLIMEC